MGSRHYIAIDLKSFYASVECIERGLDPLDTCLVVADSSRTEKTICLAVSPALKRYGTGGRPRLFEVVQKIREVNLGRGKKGKSESNKFLESHPDYSIDFIIAPPRMQLYIDYSSRIYDIYLHFIAPEDIHVYSIDEVFIDVSSYLKTYNMSTHELAMTIIREVLKKTGVTATAGIGSNLYLSKIAMDIVAKKMPPDKDGVRIAELDEMSYRKILWDHQPLTDFWRVGRGIARSLASYNIFTMGDIARQSINNEQLLYNLFGVNAELLIDHAWGWEPVTISDIKDYKPETKSLSSGQVLQEPYTAEKVKTVVLEMADAISFDLIEQKLVTNQIVLTIGYDVESLKNETIRFKYKGKIKKDFYGREVPNHSHGTANFEVPTSSSNKIMDKVSELFDRIINPDLLVRRITLSVNNLIDEKKINYQKYTPQLDLFSDWEEIQKQQDKEIETNRKERNRQQALLNLRKRYGKNVVLRGLNYAEGSTQKERNKQIGGHKA
ncbi:MAG: DNA methylase [Muribaculaceae bacterium]|nr:DNA methylase [Muribaculaceae bacterium]